MGQGPSGCLNRNGLPGDKKYEPPVRVGRKGPAARVPGVTPVSKCKLRLLMEESSCKEKPRKLIVSEAMAGGMAIAKGGGGSYNGRLTPFVVISCVVAAVGGFIFGYDIGVSGGVTSMPPFLDKFFPSVFRKIIGDTKVSNYCKYDSQLLTSFTSSLYLAGLVASFFASPVTRDFGRKPSTLIGGVALLLGSVLNGAATNVSMLIIGRILLGVGVGFTNQSIPLYLSEMAPPRYRGAINSGFQLCNAFGVFAANIVNYGTEKIKDGWGWRVSLALVAVPASILTIGAIFLPETPNSIIQRTDDPHKARAMLQKIRGTADVDAELDDLIQASEAAKSVPHPFKNILQRKYRPQLVMVSAIPFFLIMTGINMIGFYTPVLLRTIGLNVSFSLIMSAVISGVVGMFSTAIAMAIMDKYGRRSMLISGGVVMFVSFIAVGIILAIKLGDQGSIGKGYAIFVLIMMSAYVAGFSWSWGPLGFLIPSEILSLEVRSAGQSIAVAVNFLMTFIIAQSFLAMLCHMKAGIFFFFAFWVAVMTVFVYFLLPETANVPIEKMDEIWKEHWFWKRYVESAIVPIEQIDGPKVTA